MDFTKEQKLAIDLRDKNILVSAAAGSGKTAILIERLVNKVLGVGGDRIDIDRFLIVTFTKDAASEMKERIEAKLNDRMSNTCDELEIDYIQKQLGLLGKTSISTIHAFCYKLIKTYFNQLNLEPNMKIGSDIDVNLLKQEILEEVIEEEFTKKNEEFYRLCDAYEKVNEIDYIKSILLKIYSFSQSTVFPKKWLEEKVSLLEQENASIFEESLFVDITDELKSLEKLILRAIGLAEKPNGPAHYLNIFETDYQNLLNIDKTNLFTIINSLNKIYFMKLPSKRKKSDLNENLKENAKSLRTDFKERIEYLTKTYGILVDETILAKTAQTGKIFREFIRLVNIFEEKYTIRKKEAGILDYNDLEHYAIELLINDNDGKIEYTEIAKELGKYYKEVYIDEYQDVNDAQENILKAISNNGSISFMVGDVKQSIYKFRLTNPKIFLNKYETFKKSIKEFENNNVCIDLSKNFRSRKNILMAVNDIFGQLMNENVGDIVYDETQQLYVGNEYDFGQVTDIATHCELHLLEILKNKDVPDNDINKDNNVNESDSSNVELEAKMVANLIKDIVKGNANPKIIYDKQIGAYRPVEFRDIVILVRSKKNSTIFEEELHKMNINAYAEVSKSFFNAIEIELMINFLKIIDNINQDIPLISVLRSSLVGLDFNELSDIRTQSLEGSFYEACKSFMVNNKNDKLIEFFNMIYNFRKLANMVPVSELINQIYLETGYLRYVTMLDNGELKASNLRILKQEAINFEENMQTGLFNFINYLNKLSNNPENLLQQAKLGTDQNNLVKIKSIHKSKGLEFPIVFLSNSHTKFNTTDIQEDILIHNELGFGAKLRDVALSLDYTTLPYLAIKNKIKNENISEEMRILYVALTRAKEKLIITGITDNYDKLIKDSMLYSEEKMDILTIRKQTSYLKWIMLSLMTNKYINPATGTKDALWSIKKWSSKDFALNQTEQIAHPMIDNILNQITKISYSENKINIFEKLNYKYVHQLATTLPQKTTVTQFQNNIQNSNREAYIPKFIKETNFHKHKSLLRGNIIHEVFEHLDYLKYTSVEAIKTNLIKLIKDKKIDSQALEIIDINTLYSFANSDIICRMRKSSLSFKEQSFIYEMPLDEFIGETVLVQGIVDAYFEEEEKIILIDYKTGLLNKNNINKYEKQINLYATALEAITKKFVIEKYLYLYTIDEFIKI
ncbi:helicase-exonuclease AddAB subunit AddA [Candidatus Epulonipiscioides gigas]|nr:helicase-exonuclease AddAB subunit AddA [Epulopiscium sp. SCG-C07WGA-EpuloA2]